MGCDGYILDMHKPVKVVMRCYDCGKIINQEDPLIGHANCDVQRNDDWVLKVILDIDNWEDR